jgi:hypothetical protein
MSCPDCHPGAAQGAASGAPSALPPVPPETVGNAAALWVTVGNVRGFTIGADWAVRVVEQAVARARGRWLPERLRGPYERELAAAAVEIRKQIADKAAQATALEPAARSAVGRLEEARLAKTEGGLTYGTLIVGFVCFVLGGVVAYATIR